MIKVMGNKIHDSKSRKKPFMAKFSQYMVMRLLKKSKVMGYFKLVKVLALGITLSAVHKVFSLPAKKG
jgi:hypothetical protein